MLNLTWLLDEHFIFGIDEDLPTNVAYLAVMPFYASDHPIHQFNTAWQMRERYT